MFVRMEGVREQFRLFSSILQLLGGLILVVVQAKDVLICGVEITEGAAKVHKHPFSRSTAFVLGNEVS